MGSSVTFMDCTLKSWNRVFFLCHLQLVVPLGTYIISSSKDEFIIVASEGHS